MKLTEDQKTVNNFLKDLVKEITKKYKKDIDFIIIYGSAARGEFIVGVSDIDLVIQTKNSKSVPKIKAYSEKIFWKLDRKHKTKFNKVCKVKKSKNLMSKLVKNLEDKMGLYVPVFVFGPDEIDWKNGRYIKKGYSAIANVFYPSSSVFNKFKIEGKILFGRDIRKTIKPKMSLWERFKTIMVPMWLTLGASFIVIISPKKAVKNCTKALFYELEATLFYLDQLTLNDPKYKKQMFEKVPEFKVNINQLNKFAELNIDLKYQAVNPNKFSIIAEALKYKKHGFKGTRKQARKFVWRTWTFINALNFIVMVKRILNLH